MLLLAKLPSAVVSAMITVTFTVKVLVMVLVIHGFQSMARAGTLVPPMAVLTWVASQCVLIHVAADSQVVMISTLQTLTRKLSGQCKDCPPVHSVLVAWLRLHDLLG